MYSDNIKPPSLDDLLDKAKAAADELAAASRRDRSQPFSLTDEQRLLLQQLINRESIDAAVGWPDFVIVEQLEVLLQELATTPTEAELDGRDITEVE